MSTFSMDDRKSWANQVTRKFSKFWQIKLPVPVDPIADIYRRAYSDKEWAAVRYLKQERPKALNVGSSFELYWTDDTSGNHKCPHITFEFPKKMTMPDIGIKLSELPTPIQNRLRSWIVSVNYFRSLQQELSARCKGVMGNPTGTGNNWQTRRRKDLDPCVNTPNQLYRLWPDCQPVMMSEWKREIQLAAMKSRLPSHVGYQVRRNGNLHWATVDGFRTTSTHSDDYERKRFAEINQILLMVSLAEGVKRPKFPTFHGEII